MLRNAVNHARRKWELPPIGDVVAYLVTDRTIVASDPLLGELPPDASAAVLQTGSLTMAASDALDPGLERFLAGGEPPVYIGFGSMPDGGARDTTRMVVGVLESIGRRGVIASGWAGLGEGSVPPTIFAVRSAPHAVLLPRVALAVHHGGAGTTAAAARAGIPHIAVPFLADQPYWGHQIFRRGLGSRPIPRSSLSAGKLAAAIQYVLSRPHIADRAREIKVGLDRTDGVSAWRRSSTGSRRSRGVISPPDARLRPIQSESIGDPAGAGAANGSGATSRS